MDGVGNFTVAELRQRQVARAVNGKAFRIPLWIVGRPCVSKNRKRAFMGRGARFPVLVLSKDAKAYKKEAKAQLEAQWEGVETIPVGVLCNAKIISYVTNRQKARIDANNLYDAPLDALEAAGVLENDRQVRSHDGSRWFVDNENPRVEITLTRYEE